MTTWDRPATVHLPASFGRAPRAAGETAWSLSARFAAPWRPMGPVVLRAVLLDTVLLVTTIGLFIGVLVQMGYPHSQREAALIGLFLSVGGVLSIGVRGGYEGRHFGAGSEEYKCVVSAGMTLLSAVGIVTLALPSVPPLRIVIPSLVLGTSAVLLGRWILRTWLRRQRSAGRYVRNTILVGDRRSNAALAEDLGRDTGAGFRVVGAVPPPVSLEASAVDHWLAEVMSWIRSRGVHAVAVPESSAIRPELLQRLSWRLEGPRVDLLVSPVLSGVAGPRVSVQPAAGLPLLHLDEPSLTGPKRLLKRALDLVVAVPALILLLPLFVVIAIAVRLDSPGPVFYVSRRVGQRGRIFGCLKFRTMTPGADQMRDGVIGAPDDDIVTRYRQDPRITRVGHLLRRWSLDELPQVLNVVSGSMSLVGPRPVLPEELDLLDEPDHRRHLIKPGITGLWQVSGRKEVSWPERMRMDLAYLEDWSLALDLAILAKTVKAVFSGHGAY